MRNGTIVVLQCNVFMFEVSIFISHEKIAYFVEELVSFAEIGIHWKNWVEHSQQLLRKVLEQLNGQFLVEME